MGLYKLVATRPAIAKGLTVPPDVVASHPMKMNFSALLAGLCLLALTVGCYHTVEGKGRVGKPFSKDRLESRYERPSDQVYAAAKEVLAFNGTLTGENTISKTVEAKVDNNHVWVKIEEMEPNITRVLVQARKGSGGGNVDLASEIDKQIALQLQSK